MNLPSGLVLKIGREVGVKLGDVGFIHGTDVVAIELLQSGIVVFGVGHGSVNVVAISNYGKLA
jgi:hypothetical protein